MNEIMAKNKELLLKQEQDNKSNNNDIDVINNKEKFN